jgi:DNA-directed RNA polymerase subunit beta'
VDVSHNVIVREEDCGTDEGIPISAFKHGKEVVETLRQRLIGRTALLDVVHPETGEVIAAANEQINEDAAKAIEDSGIEEVWIRSVMTCHSETGICAKCYGRNLATGDPVQIGEAVGITAAQSIGEPGTQLTMRTFHTGGVAGGDITQGLPRVEELFEARKPKSIAEICEESGKVLSIETRADNKREIKVLGDEEKTYVIPFASRIIVEEDQEIKAGDALTYGPLYPKDILRLQGEAGVYNYLLKEVQRVYKLQGVDINDKHIEIIVSQMLSKLKVDEPGDTNLLPGGLYSKNEIEDANAALEEGQTPAAYKKELLGITKASLATNSFLSAASFQETTRVLTDAAIKGKTDRLLGLKENVIIGKLIPAGTGMKRYKNINIDYGENTELMEHYKEEIQFNEDDSYDEIKELGDMTDVAPEKIPAAFVEDTGASEIQE